MEPRLTFLGTGGDAAVVGKQLRSSGGIVLKISGYQLWIDPGPGALGRAAQCDVNLRETTAILVSHCHVNHANDVNAIVAGMTYNGLDVKGVVVCSESVREAAFSAFHQRLVERVITAHRGSKAGIGDIEVDFLKASHTDDSAVGFRITANGMTVCYSGDSSMFAGNTELYQGADILVLNTVHTAETKSNENLSVADAESIIASVKPKLTVITHFGMKLVQEDPLLAARKLQMATKQQVIAAKDGLSINPHSYARARR